MHLRSAASVDNAIAHDRRAGHVVAVDQRFAGMARDALHAGDLFFGDGSAEAGHQIVIPRVARAEQDDALVD
jgi:hypothetical protein